MSADRMPRPSYDRELQHHVDTNPDSLIGTITREAIDEYRARPRTRVADLLEGRALDFSDHLVPTIDGTWRVPVGLFRPSGAQGALPLLYCIHGGGMVFGDRFSGLEHVLDLALELGFAVATPEYRLAPEHPHPTPVEDCHAGVRWMAGAAASLGLDPERVVVAGTSAGGGLAAAVAHLARDRAEPVLIGQLLLSPMLDHRNSTVSSRQFSGAGQWDRESNALGWEALLGVGHADAEVSPYASPSRAGDLAGLPPAFLDIGSAEVFRDEVVAYASGLWAAGVACELHVWSGGFHGFQGVFPRAALSTSAAAAQRSWLRRMLWRESDRHRESD